MATVIGSRATLRVREVADSELDSWDAHVRSFEDYHVGHTRAWIESLAAAGCGKPIYLLVEKNDDVVACMPGLLRAIGRLRLFGSPLEGWQTATMGPVFHPDRITTYELMADLLAVLEGRHGVSHIELLHSSLDPRSMRILGFEGERVPTYRVPLHPGDEKRMFRALKDSARRNVRRAERLGLIVRFEEDESFVENHDAQLRLVFRRAGHRMPYGRHRIMECFRHMKAAGNLLACAVYLPDGRTCIASGMFLVEGAELLLWSWAHHPHYRWYRGTELMTWSVMQRAAAAGCNTFDMMGRGDFKRNFGAEPDTTKYRWMRARPKILMTMRQVAGSAYRWQQAVRGRAAELTARIGTSSARPQRLRRATACVMGDADLVRALGLAGIRSVVIVPPGTPARFSRHTRAALEWVDPWRNPELLVDRMIEFAATEPEPPVLYYQDDRALLFISRYRDRLERGFRFLLPPAPLVEQLMDKGRFQELAARLDLPVPPGRTLRPTDTPPDDLEYPIVLKPLMRRVDRWRPVAGPAKAVRLDSQAALHALWPRLAAARIAVVAQRHIPGPESQVESYHVYIDERGEIVTDFSGHKIRTYPTRFGDSSSIVITNSADVMELGRRIVERLGVRGVTELEFKRSPDGRLFLLEVNPRFTFWHHLAARAGVNVPALVHADLVHASRGKVSTARLGARWCKVWLDFAAARQSGMPFLWWLRWVGGCDALSAFHWRDPMPLLAAGAHRFLHRGDANSASPDGKREGLS